MKLQDDDASGPPACLRHPQADAASSRQQVSDMRGTVRLGWEAILLDFCLPDIIQSSSQNTKWKQY